ncbi:MAG: radical SAM protein [Methanocellales archaeon]|nr:radical SAM protein [Methanocellales archaeon]
MTDVVLVKMEDPMHHQLYPPFSLLYPASALLKEGYSVKIIHEKGTKENIDQLRELVIRKNPILVGFSSLTGSPLLFSLKASEEISKIGVPIAWGGIHATILPEITLREKSIDFVVVGEGEQTIVELVKALENGGNFGEIRGLGYKKDTRLKFNPQREFITDLDDYELPWNLVKLERYFQEKWGCKKVLPINTSRGCPHRCGFCYNLLVHKRKWRGHSSEYVLEQIEELKKHGIDGIIFSEDEFFINKKRALDIVKNIDLSWGTEIRADYISEKFIDELKDNCEELFIGAESGSDRVLEIMQKDLTVAQIEEAIKICKNAGISVGVYFMIGIPGETKEDMKRTLEFMYHLYEKYDVKLDGPKVYTPYPGTPLFESAVKYGFTQPNSSVSWATEVGRFKCNLPWIKESDRGVLENLFYLVQLAQMKNPLVRPLQKVEEFRWRNGIFKFWPEVKFAKFLSKYPNLVGFFLKYLEG